MRGWVKGWMSRRINESALFLRHIAGDSEMTMTNNEFNVLRVMAEKDIA